MSSRKQNIASAVLITCSIIFLFIPVTYYGFLDYIIENTIINMNLGRDNLETEKASVALFNGAGLTFISQWKLNLMIVFGFLFLYAGLSVKFIGKKLFEKSYWRTFRVRP